MSLRRFIQQINLAFDKQNANSYVKMIFFSSNKEGHSQSTLVKMVVVIKTFTSTNYLAIEARINGFGFPNYEILTYYFDTDLQCIRDVIGEASLDEFNFVGCGDLKAIYTAE